MPDQFKVVCGTCKVSPDIISNDLGEDVAVCPLCGRRDTAEDAIRFAQEHLQHEAQIAFQEGVGEAVKDREFIRFAPEPLPERTFRWHAATA